MNEEAGYVRLSREDARRFMEEYCQVVPALRPVPVAQYNEAVELMAQIFEQEEIRRVREEVEIIRSLKVPEGEKNSRAMLGLMRQMRWALMGRR